ncbi:hypothetical protein F5Y16DRAFT_268412 [Xylariaceae sp. FL0255]|nr:hypothetical protein F5Y16DRAFT_268412 [Xylariaceae sp. FL0255]
MQSKALLLNALMALVGASPLERRQQLNIQLLKDTPDPVTASIPIGQVTQATSYNMPAATEAAISEPLVSKRGLIARDACDPQPAGSGPAISPDTAEEFLASDILSQIANTADVPTGYVNTFTNLQASNSAYGYLGLTSLSSYSPDTCAQQCNNIGDACSGFNLFFERDPTLEPADACPNPASTTVIKCVFWGGYLGSESATNSGQWRDQFQVVVAGSNGYMKTRVPAISGFNGISIGNNAINAPSNCLGEDTYMGSKVFSTSYFDPSLCAAACDSQSEYDEEHPGSGPVETCQFFVTYLVEDNGNAQGQYCSLYTQAWDASYATNSGGQYGSDTYTNVYGYAYTNSTDSGVPICSETVAS